MVSSMDAHLRFFEGGHEVGFPICTAALYGCRVSHLVVMLTTDPTYSAILCDYHVSHLLNMLPTDPACTATLCGWHVSHSAVMLPTSQQSIVKHL